MKKKIIFRVVLIVLCVLCTLSVLQVRNVLANHRQNDRDERNHEMDSFLSNEFFEEKPDDSIEYSHNLPQQGIEGYLPPAFKDMSDLYNLSNIKNGDLLYRYEPIYMYRGWNDDPEIYPPDKLSVQKSDDLKRIIKLEAEYRTKVLSALQRFYSSDRVRDVNILIDKDILNPNSNCITVSTNIDGTWNWKYDEKGKPVVLPDGSIEREYPPVSEVQLRAATLLIKNAIGYNSARGDSITVMNIPFDRTEEHKAEDAAYFAKKRIQMTAIIILSGLILLLIPFVIFRKITEHAKMPDTKIP
jgi:hypothetical protein